MGCSRFLITNATSREWFFFSVPQMLSLNTTYDCCAHFLCREILLFITHCTKAFSNQKTRGGISLPCCLQRTFLLTHYHLKQTICLLSISPCRFLHLHFPCLLPSLSTPSCCIVIVASPAQAHQGPKHPHAASPPPAATDRHLCSLAVPPRDTHVEDGHSMLTCPGSKSLRKLQSSDRILQKAVFSVFDCRQQTIKSLCSYPHFMPRISILGRPRLDYPQLGSENVTMWQPACLKARKKGWHDSSSHIISAIEKRPRL